MFTYEERIKAVELYNKYQSVTKVIRTLGYPSKNSLRSWVAEYQKYGDIHYDYQTRPSKYSEEQIQKAINHYLTTGRNVSKTMRELGYPHRSVLKQWLFERVPEYSKKTSCKKRKESVYLSSNYKIQAVTDLCVHEKTAEEIAKDYNIERTSIYIWREQLLGKKEDIPIMPKRETKTSADALKDEIAELNNQAEELKKQIYRLQLEKDVLEKAAEIIKKDQGITLKTLTNKEKAIVIDTLREKYSLKELLSVFQMAKSSYCYQQICLKRPDKYETVRAYIRESFLASNNAYGYRRIYLDVKEAYKTVSEKVIRRIMKEEKLVVKLKKKRKYNSYMGEITPAVKNIVNRDFHANKPNEKWLTDITEFNIPAGKVYLSPIIDCFDGLPVSWTIGIHPDADLVNTMLDNAINTLKENECPIVHSDRGAHYRWPGWIERMNKANLTRSMSKKGCSPDNSACEGFFGRLKNEMFYNRSWSNTSIEEFIKILNRYIHWYGNKRRKLTLGGLSPIQYRKKLGLIT